MRRFAIAVLCVILILATPVAPLPYPGANDAGTGGDAGDYPEVATPIDPGAYVGEVGFDVVAPAVVWWEYDHRDVYRLDVPPQSAIHLTVEVPEDAYVEDTFLLVRLSGPDGDTGATLAPPPGRRVVHRSLGTIAGGPWNLTFVDFFHEGPQPYRFTVSYQRFDHGVVLDGQGEQATAWEIDFPEGVDGRVDIMQPGYRPPPPVEGTYHVGRGRPAEEGEHVEGGQNMFAIWFGRHPGGGCGDAHIIVWAGGEPAMGRNGFDDEDVLWTEGLPYDVGLEAPLGGTVDPDGGGHEYHFDMVAPDGNASVRWGYADFDGVNDVGRVLWNGPDAPTIAPVGADAEFLTLQDFTANESGLGAQVGPVAFARTMSANVTVPRDMRSSVVFANGLSPNRYTIVGDTPLGRVEQEVPFGVSTPTMRVEMPNGTTRNLTDDFQYWVPWDRFSKQPWADTHIPAGPWRFHLDQVDGLEGDQVRVMRLGFGFPFECPA